MNHPVMFLDRDNKTKLVPASYFTFKNSSERKKKVIINNHFNFSIIKKLIKLFYLHCSREKVVEKQNKENLKVITNILCQINQEILKASKNNQNSWKGLRLMCI